MPKNHTIAQRTMQLLPLLLCSLLSLSSSVEAAPFAGRRTSQTSAFAARSLLANQRASSCDGTSSATTNLPSSLQTLSKLRGGDVDASKIVGESYGWLMSLGSPAALVAGAVIGSLYEFNRNDDLELERKDGKLITAAKKFSKLLLVFAFALELLSIFVVTVMGTVLKSMTAAEMAALKVTEHTTSISFLRDNFEFEYLTARVTYLVGLLNWLTAIALHFIIPNGIETRATRNMDKLISSILVTLIFLMISFYNSHVTVYSNIAEMLIRFKVLAVQNYLAVWPPRPLSFVMYPCVGSILYFIYQCFVVNA